MHNPKRYNIDYIVLCMRSVCMDIEIREPTTNNNNITERITRVYWIIIQTYNNIIRERFYFRQFYIITSRALFGEN